MWGGAALLKQLSMTAVPSTTPGEKKKNTFCHCGWPYYM